MKCCVPLCRNTGEDLPITDGKEWITFNRFPRPGSQRMLWLEMLGLTESDLPPSAAVCSDHFKRNDFTVMNDGIIKLNKNSIPLQFCMICLASGHSKMYSMSQNYLEKAYTTMTGIAVSYIRDKINTQPRVCIECAQRLVNCDRFRNKGFRAYKSLMQILQNDKVLTFHNLKSVNRVRKQLISNIEKHTFEPDHCDLHVKCNEEDNTIYTEEECNSDIKVPIDMKREIYDDYEEEVFYPNESDDFKNNFHTNNDINNDDIKKPGIINYDVHVNDTNILTNPDVTNIKNDEAVVLMVIDEADEEKSLRYKQDIDNKYLIPRFDKTIENLQSSSVHSDTKSININEAQSITHKQIKVKKIKEMKEIVKINNSLPNIFQETESTSNIQNNDQLSSKSEILEASVSKSKKQYPIGNSFMKTILTYEEQLADIQRRKHTEHYKLYPYKCDICFTGRWSLFTYNRHMDKHTDKHGKWECAICGLRHKTRTRLRLHVRAHAERYSCTRCDFVTGTSDKVEHHARWHSGLAFKCPHCDAKFRKKSTYFSHIRLKHPSDYACPLCGFSFVSEHGVKLHLIMIHRTEDVQNLSGPSCVQCNVRFASEAAYDTHMAVSPKHVGSGIPMRNETQYEPRKRPPRNKSQDTPRKAPPPKKSLDKPQKVRPLDKPQRESREGHPPAKTYPGRLCDVCGKNFQSLSSLDQHMNMHTGAKPYKCGYCDKSYFSQVSLKYHLRSHSDIPRPYSCGVCHREFSFWSNRQRHMLTHNPKRPSYTCDICNKSFTLLASKVSHVAHVHDKVPWPKRHRPQRHARKRERGEDYSGSSDAYDAQEASVADTDDASEILIIGH